MEIVCDLQYGPSEFQLLDVYVPKGNTERIVVLCLHGGFYCRGDKKACLEQCRILCEQNWVVFSCNYDLGKITRGVWRQILFWSTLCCTLTLYMANVRKLIFFLSLFAISIAWFVYVMMYVEDKAPENISDLELAVCWIRTHAVTYGGDPNRIALVGHSAGAHLASLLGSRQHAYIRGVVAISGVYSLARMHQLTCGDWLLRCGFGETDDFVEFSPVNVAHEQSPPHLLINANYDFTLKRHAWDMAFTLKSKGVYVQCKTYPGDHSSIMKNWRHKPSQFKQIISFILDCTSGNRPHHLLDQSDGSIH